MAELLRARCKQGTLIVTEEAIIIELKGFGMELRQEQLFRASLTSIDSAMGAPSIMGLGGGTNLTFHGKGGEVLHADLVSPGKAQEIRGILSH